MAETVHELAYREALRAVDQQQRTLESVRARAGVLLSGATISTSFFGSQVFASKSFGFWSITATALYTFLGACVVAILWPQRAWLYLAPLEAMLSEQIHPSAAEPTVADAQRTLTADIVTQIDRNARRLDQLFVLLSSSAALFLAETVAWLISAFVR